jgi:hypothetical protein
MSKRAILIGVPGGGINVDLAVERLTPVLHALGFTVAQCQGNAATRDGILAALDRLIEISEPGDAALIHYFGHGGRVQFTDHDSDRVFGYVTCTKSVRGVFEGVLDIELSDRMTQLDARCGNVTVMLDCCFSGELVRASDAASAPPVSHRREPAPDWVRSLALEQAPGKADLALDSHPRIVRLCAASPKREGFAAVRGGRNIGRLTEALLDALEEVGDDWPKLCWATIGHRLREHVVDALAMEGQWVALAGPQARRLFSTQTIELPGSVGFLPGDDPGQGWLRAGWQQGVMVGDRWGVLDPCAGEGVRILAEAEVTKVDRNRAELRLLAPSPSALRLGMPAIVLALHEPMLVAGMDDSRLGGSAWLRGSSDAETAVRREGAALVIESSSHPRARVIGDGEAIALLEDRARVHVLLRSLATHEPSECPLAWRWSLVDSPARPLPESGATLRSGDRIRVDLSLPADAPPFNWFVSVLLVDVAGRPRLLNTRMPEGLELAPGDSEVIGVRPGRRGAQGLELRWPDAVIADEGPACLLILASRRPIELAHLVLPQAHDQDDALALQGLAGDTLRDRKPEHTRGCAWARLDFRLQRLHTLDARDHV